MLSISHAAAPRASAGYVLPGQNRILRLCRGNNLRAISPFLPSRIFPHACDKKHSAVPAVPAYPRNSRRNFLQRKAAKMRESAPFPYPVRIPAPPPILQTPSRFQCSPTRGPAFLLYHERKKPNPTQEETRRRTAGTNSGAFIRLFLTLGENTLDYLSRINK